MSDSIDKATLEQQLDTTFTTMNEGLAKYIEWYKNGVAFQPDVAVDMDRVASTGVPQTFTIIYDYQQATMPIEYVNDNNGSIVKRDTITGFLGQKGQYKPVLPAGYQLVSYSPINYDLASKQNATLVIHVVPIPPTPVTPSPAPTPAPQPNNNSWNPTTPKPADGKTGLQTTLRLRAMLSMPLSQFICTVHQTLIRVTELLNILSARGSTDRCLS